MKKCTVCLLEKAFSEFPRHRTLCKPCDKAYRKERIKGKGYHLKHYAANREKCLAASRAWYAKNPNYRTEYYAANKAKIDARHAANHAKAPEATNERVQRRRRAKRQANITWGDQNAIREVYALAKFMTDISGLKHNVDHIVPLQSPLVCGLHVAANLQVLTETANKSKGNKNWPDMPERTNV